MEKLTLGRRESALYQKLVSFIVKHVHIKILLCSLIHVKIQKAEHEAKKDQKLETGPASQKVSSSNDQM